MCFGVGRVGLFATQQAWQHQQCEHEQAGGTTTATARTFGDAIAVAGLDAAGLAIKTQVGGKAVVLLFLYRVGLDDDGPFALRGVADDDLFNIINAVGLILAGGSARVVAAAEGVRMIDGAIGRDQLQVEVVDQGLLG